MHLIARRLFLTVTLAAIAGQATPSRLFAQVQDRSYYMEAAGEDIAYSLFVPTTYDGTRPYPLIVALHARFGDPAQFIRRENFTELAEAHGYIVVAPMGYNDDGWYGSMGPGIGRITAGRVAEQGLDFPENLGELSELDVLNVLALVRNEFNIDQERTYLMGHSMGGGGAWHLGIEHSRQWVALGLIAPATYTSPEALSRIEDMPVIVIQGDADRWVDLDVTRAWVAKMEELGMTYRYVEVAGGGHSDIASAHLSEIFEFFDEH